MSRYASRRAFLAGALASVPLPGLLAETDARSPLNLSTPLDSRLASALDIRTEAALLQSRRSIASVVTNGDEDALPGRIGSFAKGLPQNRYGEVLPSAYDALLVALKSGQPNAFERLPRSGGRKLSNPQSAFAYHLEGGDPHTFSIPTAPSLRSEECSFDVSEIYWQSLCRDVPFADYATSSIIQRAAEHLGTTPATVFRGPTRGDRTGPYISQFLYKPVPYGSGRIEQRYKVPVAGSDFMTVESEWAQMQLGFLPWRSATDDAALRYIRNGRDLAEYVHYDFTYQAHLGAALILVNSNAKSILNCNQFKSPNNPYRYSTVEDGFCTFGPPEAADWIGRVSTAALKAAYYQKWSVHRRVRPETLGGYIHQTRTGARNYPIHKSLLFSKSVDEVFKQTGSYFLPQTYPEGCPMHPSYPSGHAAIAGACAVVLKACFDGLMLLPGCVEPSHDGLSLVPCQNFFPTVGDEIDKLAFNIAMGRNWAGIHYRSDSIAGLHLGEEVGISILQDMARTYTEDFRGFTFNRFDGTEVHINPRGEVS